MLGKRLINSNSAASGATCTTDTLQILGDTSCVAYYKMSDATDESGNYDGTPSNVNFNVAGKFGNAGSFNGSSSKIEAINSALSSNTIRSYSVWFKKSSSSEKMILANNNGSTYGAHIAVSAGNQLNGWVYNEEQNNYYFNLLGGSVTFNVWHHAVLTWGVNASDCVLYLNGASVATASSVNGNVPTTTAPNNFKIGDYTGNLFWNGSIDQIRIFNKALSSTEVTTLNDEVYCQPTIVPTDYFNPVIYTGDAGNNGNTLSKTVTGVGFQPDFVWGKSRNAAVPNVLFDSVRGAEKWLNSDNTNAEANNQYTQATFLSDGFTTGTSDGLNKTNIDFVAWNWKAGGADVLNEEGTIDSQVSANTDAGFSVVKFTGSLTSGQTVGHGLTEPPSVVILKDLDSVANWYIYHKGTGTTSGYINHLRFDATAGDYSDKIFYPINFNSSTFTPGNDETVLQGSVIAYCFHSVDGYSKIGSYTGTGGTGNSIVTGFRPAFVMIKGAVTPNATNWWMFDNKRNPTNPLGKGLISNLSAAEQAQGTYLDFNSNGFTWLSGSGEFNDSGNTFIFMAFAEEVFVPDNFFNDDSTVATYKLNGDAGDDSGNGYNGTPSNVTYAAGKFDDAAVFNGSSSKIVLPTSTFSPSTFTISAWCNVSSDTDENTILELVDNQTYPNHTTIVLSAGSTAYSSRFLIRNHTTNQYNYESSGTVTKNVWKHYAMTYDGSTVKSYIDGFLVNSGSLTLSNTVGTISSIQLGLSSGIRYLNGKIDQVRIFDRALDSGEVTQLYNE